jgi:hypothetical protein
LAAVIAAALFAAPASAKAPVQRRGLCAEAPTHWILNVQKGAVFGTLRIRFVVRGATPNDTWQVALSDGDHGLPTVDRIVDVNGVFRVIRVIHDRARHDHIIASATNKADGGQTCTGRVTF